MEASKAWAGKLHSSSNADHPSAANGLSIVLLTGSDSAATTVASDEARSVAQSISSQHEILVTAGSVVSEASPSERCRWQQAARRAKHPWVALVNADGRYRLDELSRLALFSEDFDAVVGYRVGAAASWLSRARIRVAAVACNLLLRTGARDPGCGIKLVRRDLLSEMPPLADDSFAPVELLARLRLANAQVVEVGVNYQPANREDSRQDWSFLAIGKQAFQSVRSTYQWTHRLASFWWSQTLFPGSAEGRGVACALSSGSGQAAADRSSHSELDHADVWSGGRALAAWGLLIAAAVIFFFGHLSYPLLEPDESRYARIAQEMNRSGDYLVPRRFNEPYLDKPPLLYWLTAASYGLFGVSARSARVVCAVAGVATVLLTYGLGRRLVGQRAAWIGAFSLMLCAGFGLGGKFLIMDGLLTCFVTASMLSGYLAIHGPRVRTGWCVAASLFCGLGVMTKGPLAVVLLLPPLVASRWLTRSGAKMTWWQWAWCLIPGAALALPWFALITFSEPQFLEHFLWRHHFERFTTDFIHEEPWWYYVPVLLIGMFPATLLLGPLTLFLFGSNSRFRQRRTCEMGYLLLVAVWTLTFFSFSRGKLPPYIIPALPPLCLLCGRLVDLFLLKSTESSFFERTRRQMPEFLCSMALIAIAVLGIVDLAFGGGRRWGFVLDVVMIVSGLALFVVLARGGLQDFRYRWSTAGAAAWVVMSYAFLNFYPDVAYSRSIAMQAQRICAEQGNPEMPIVFYARREESLMFYMPPDRLHTFSGKEQAGMIAFLRHHPQALLVSDRDDIEAFRHKFGGSVVIEEVGGRGHLYLAEPAAPNLASGAKAETR